MNDLVHPQSSEPLVSSNVAWKSPSQLFDDFPIQYKTSISSGAFPWFSYDFPMIVPWFSYGFSHGFPCKMTKILPLPRHPRHPTTAPWTCSSKAIQKMLTPGNSDFAGVFRPVQPTKMCLGKLVQYTNEHADWTNENCDLNQKSVMCCDL